MDFHLGHPVLCIFILTMYGNSVADLSAAVRGGQQWGRGDPRQMHYVSEEVQDLSVKDLQCQCR